MSDIRVLGLRPTRSLVALLALSVLGLVLIAYRFLNGLGAATNLSDGHPWGFWIGIDILVGIALAAGGFVMAGVVHIFGGRRFHSLARPAILTALLGYLLFIFALSVDLGRPWHIWVALISWNHTSPMFEVAWCVMFYTFVLILEFVPAVLERLERERIHRAWREVTPWIVLAVLSLFIFAMTDSRLWAVTTFSILLAWEILMRVGVVPREKQMPLLLIMAGIMLSTLHQSSLGTLFLIVDKLSPLWYTQILPLLFFLSAVMVAPAMVIVEGMASGHALESRQQLALLERLGAAMPYLIGGYLLVRVADLLARGEVSSSLAMSLQSGWWWLEVGLLLFALIYSGAPEIRTRATGLYASAIAAVLGLVVHRTGVAMIGITVPEYPPYVPAWSEIMITVGIISLGVLAYRLAEHHLPIYEMSPEAPSDDRRARAPRPEPAHAPAVS